MPPPILWWPIAAGHRDKCEEYVSGLVEQRVKGMLGVFRGQADGELLPQSNGICHPMSPGQWELTTASVAPGRLGESS